MRWNESINRSITSIRLDIGYRYRRVRPNDRWTDRWTLHERAIVRSVARRALPFMHRIHRIHRMSFFIFNVHTEWTRTLLLPYEKDIDALKHIEDSKIKTSEIRNIAEEKLRKLMVAKKFAPIR